MRMIASFDPSQASSGQFDSQVVNPCGMLVLFNESPVGLQLTLPDGGIAGLPAFYFRSYKISKPGAIKWQEIYMLQVTTGTLSIVLGEAYESTESKSLHFTEGPLNRQTNIGNSVPVSTSVSTLSNENNAVGTEVLDIGTAAHNKLVDIFNDHFLWCVEQSGILHQVLKGQTSGSPLQLGQTGDTTEILGNLKVDSNIVFNGDLGVNSSNDIIDATGTTTYIKGSVGILGQVPNGTTRVQIDTTGITIISGGIQSVTGQRIKAFSTFGVGTGASVTINHNLGQTPNQVAITESGNGSQTQGAYNFNSSQITVVNGASLASGGIAMAN